MPYRAFVPMVSLALVLLACKFTVAWPLMRSAGDWWRPLAISAGDVVAVLVYGAIAGLALRATRGRAALHRWAWRGVVALGLVCALYAVIDVAVFDTLGVPLNVRMLAMAHRFSDMRSSITARCGPGMIGGLIGTVLLFGALAVRGSRYRASRRVALVLLIAAAAWIACGATMWARAEPDTWVRRAGLNPHAEMLASLGSKYLFDRHGDVGGPFPEAYLADFRPAQAARRPTLAQFGSPPPRNVIVVVLESVSAEYLSLYGAAYDTTPNLIAEAPHALIFERFYSNAAYTFRSVIPLTYCVHPGLPWRYRADMNRPIGPGLAGVLRGRGYRTAFLSAANPEWGGMDWIARGAGFEEVIGPEQLGGPAASSWGTEDGVLVDGLLKWIDAGRAAGRPFFVTAWTDQTHDPYTLDAGTPEVTFIDPAAHPHAAAENRYLSAIRQVDRHLGRLFAGLRQRGIADDTLVVITGDHGEAFGDRHDTNGHGAALFDECVRVPMVLWNPRMFSGRRESRVGSHVDIGPTIAHVLGVEPLAHWQGASLFSPDHPGRAYAVIDVAAYQFAVMDAGHKYILNATAGAEHLFDLRADPLERRDAGKEEPATLEEMRGRARAFVKAEERYLDVSK